LTARRLFSILAKEYGYAAREIASNLRKDPAAVPIYILSGEDIQMEAEAVVAALERVYNSIFKSDPKRLRLSDRRVLNSFECCDNCIEHALSSLQEIRRILVDKQVELSGVPDSPLYMLMELQVEAIRQFLTFEQRLNESVPLEHPLITSKEFRRSHQVRDQYFAGLEMLRAHLHRCLLQISRIADTPIPKIADHMRYDATWQLEAYERPSFPEK
jgi:hypothetical protein